MENGADPDQTAPLGALGAVRSGSALFAQILCPSFYFTVQREIFFSIPGPVLTP